VLNCPECYEGLKKGTKVFKENNIYFQKVNLKKMAKNKGAKVFPKIKNGQKKCPIFQNGNTL